MLKSIPILLFFSFGCLYVFSQTKSISSDELLQLARHAAFDKKDYTTAKAYLYSALAQSPNYSDVRIFLGRIFSWTSNYDSASICFSYVLKNNPDNEDAAIAYTDLNYWNDKNDRALTICNNALKYHPQSQEILLRKTKILLAQKKFSEANSIIQSLLSINKNNTQAREIADAIKDQSSKNKIGISYDYTSFDKQFNNPWHLTSVSYYRNTKLGTVIGRINYANRFAENGWQAEMEAYPKISKTFYSYVNAGYSDNIGVFPHWRAGYSLYANLPKSYEAELGFRYLNFSAAPIWIYTAYLGKYYKSWLFGSRVYITPGQNGSAVSSSYALNANYYLSDADNFWSATIGYGISPDDNVNSIQFNQLLKTYKALLIYQTKISKFNILYFNMGWYYQEYLPQTWGNQFQTGILWQHRF